MKRFLKKTTGFIAVLFAVASAIAFNAHIVAAGDLIENGGFENYDARTLVPVDWQVTEGSVKISTRYADVSDASIYILGGTMNDGVDTPNDVQTGTIEQLIDLSELPGWDTAHWLSVTLRYSYKKWGARDIHVYLDYLLPSCNDQTINLDDEAWDSPVSENAIRSEGFRHAGSRRFWESGVGQKDIPKVRWARVRILLDSSFESDEDFEDGEYVSAVDNLSLNVEVFEPEDACTDNLLVNSGFEYVSTAILPDNWTLLAGKISDMRTAAKTPYAGSRYVGVIGGTIAYDTEGNVTDNADITGQTAVAQVVDLSAVDGWEYTDSTVFTLSGWMMSRNMKEMLVRVESLPEEYNNTPVSADAVEWESDDVQKVLEIEPSRKEGLWYKFDTNEAAVTGVRWLRISLDLADIKPLQVNELYLGQYLAGFDQLCINAKVQAHEDLLANADFEDAEDGAPVDWQADSSGSLAEVMTSGPLPAFSGESWLGKTGADGVARYYQVLDLANSIAFWQAVDSEGNTIEYPFIKYELAAALAAAAGGKASIGLEYLPYSYNEVDAIAWDDGAWEARAWTSDGTTFTNEGGDAIDLGPQLEDESATAAWQTQSFISWLPRSRWIRLRIELDTGEGADDALAAVDTISFSAVCKRYGPYSGFGDLPEATWPELENAPDKAVPGWTGPEGDGICGGYTGQTEQNYVNPVFAGFADGYSDYSPSGQYLYNDFDACPECISGRPFTDSGWVRQIVTLGDLDLDMLADYFGPGPSGSYAPGSITATFLEAPIVNGEGHDFATFENGFVAGWVSDEIFGELAGVEVSSNGVDFVRFPTHSLTPYWPGNYGCLVSSGVFGMTGKHVNAYGDSWGTPFDLEWIADDPLVLDGTVDLDNIRYVRQVDIPGGGPADDSADYTVDPDDIGKKTSLFVDSRGNPIYDSWPTWGSGGADLDAVGVLNSSATDTDGDNITDYWDNCPATANEKQYDTDGDGFGNACDVDIDGEEGGDGSVDLADYLAFKAAYGGTGPILIPGDPGENNTYADASENWNADADFNGDLTVDLADYMIFKARYGASAPFE